MTMLLLLASLSWCTTRVQDSTACAVLYSKLSMSGHRQEQCMAVNRYHQATRMIHMYIHSSPAPDTASFTGQTVSRRSDADPRMRAMRALGVYPCCRRLCLLVGCSCVLLDRCWCAALALLHVVLVAMQHCQGCRPENRPNNSEIFHVIPPTTQRCWSVMHIWCKRLIGP